ncbi:MAG: tetratricopeptide repeat protein [Deltaproteobacteria bacterium]|jgi:cytochrome c-type biogenesis protein CcmH/NrfG|nr:tetratricopeptide repeat protein [Deltaproteobacteria bacterium]
MGRNSRNYSGYAQVRKSYAILAAIFTFALGLYGGYLFNSLSSPSGDGARTRQSISQQSQGQDAATAAAQNQDLARLLEATRANPQNVETWNQLGHWYFDNRMPNEAIQAYDRSLAMRPDDPNIITDQGVMYRSLHNHEKALELFRKANRLSPSHEQSLFNSGIVLLDLGRDAEAAQAWRQLQARNPNFKTPQGINIGEAINMLENK